MQRRALLQGLSTLAALPAVLAGLDSWAGSMATRGPRAAPANRHLGAAEGRLIAAIAEGIIPATTTPGAIGAGVPEFIALLYAEWMTGEEQAAFSEGLVVLEARTRREAGNAFLELDAAAQFTQLTSWDREAAVAGRERAPAPFFARLRGLILVSYYSSEVGQQQELNIQYGGGGDRPGGPVFGAVPFKI